MNKLLHSRIFLLLTLFLFSKCYHSDTNKTSEEAYYSICKVDSIEHIQQLKNILASDHFYIQLN